MLVTSIFSFSHNVFYPMTDTWMFWVTLILLSVIAFNLDKAKCLVYGKG